MPDGNAAVAETIGTQIDQIYSLKQDKKRAEDKVKEIVALISAKEITLVESLDAAGTTAARGHLASASINESVVPQVENWDVFYAFIRRHNKFELLERRPAAAAFRELAALRRDNTVPGLVPYTKRTLTTTKVS